MKLLLALAAATSAPTAGASPAATCPATDARGIVTTPATQVGEPNKAIRKPSAHKGDYLPAHGRIGGQAAAPGSAEPTAVINTSRSNVKSQRVAAAGTCEHAINTKGTGATGRAAVDHAINTKGTGAAGRSAAPGPGDAKDCDDSNARGLARPVAAGTTDVKATGKGVAPGTGTGPVRGVMAGTVEVRAACASAP